VVYELIGGRKRTFSETIHSFAPRRNTLEDDSLRTIVGDQNGSSDNPNLYLPLFRRAPREVGS
jgi:hypothetical protein